jgi:hypothetical protein
LPLPAKNRFHYNTVCSNQRIFPPQFRQYNAFARTELPQEGQIAFGACEELLEADMTGALTVVTGDLPNGCGADAAGGTYVGIDGV